ncbi:hypothetical protein GW579_15345 [Rahnella sp. Lac-M11]|uniref:Uncharacterized protein n=1 Tax=Rahnella contaminans TaxID=2703882 RepID=A0A6M2B738_9GAMM|nr:hypothetical protein [Rahnella contaminans]NGX88453.1 hypothetical protein [Rahnella contaminans]
MFYKQWVRKYVTLSLAYMWKNYLINVREFTVTVQSVNTLRWNTWKYFLIPRIAIRGKIF